MNNKNKAKSKFAYKTSQQHLKKMCIYPHIKKTNLSYYCNKTANKLGKLWAKYKSYIPRNNIS